MISHKILRVIAFTTSLLMVSSLIGCNAPTESSSQETAEVSQFVSLDTNNDMTDTFVELKINEIQVKDIQVVEIQIDDIVVNPIVIKDIDTLETEFVSIEDSMVTLAYENFVSIYGDDIDLSKFLTDVAIGASVVIVMVTLTTVGGPVGTFFGAVVTSEISASAIAIGAAIDAAVSGYQAYQEGGDTEYILGHMLNGVADGMKWSAMLAPVTGGVSGIKALKAVSKLKSLPGFQDVTHQQAKAIFENLPELIRNTSKVTDDTSERVLKNLFSELSSDLGEEFSEDLFLNVMRNQEEILNIARICNPYGISSDVSRELREKFWKESDIPDKTYNELLKKIQNGSVKKIDDVTDDYIKKYINENFEEFVKLYGKSLSKDFIDNSLKQSLGEEGFDLLKKTIKTKDSYRQLIKQISKDSVDSFLDDASNLLLIQCRFGADDMSKLVNLKVLSASLETKGFYSENLIDKILSLTKQDGIDAVRALGVTDADINIIGNEIAEFYRVSNPELYKYFNKSFAEIRGDTVTDFIIEKNITINNVRYAGGIMEPTGANAELIKKQYGDMYMSSQGFAIFDDYAIARVELSGLTGDDSEDIARANEAYWGKRSYKDSNYTWHHLEDGKTLILIPSDLHDAYRHTGGAKLIREGLNAIV